ncbi:MAG: hypothetical protein JWQ81_1346 [Amycolatopsis sp.]|uniref:MarR family winged helix-turn-helix transcriptional regulator n=1 Tax=Amycolatopsis sp. TaxID=37632 RepID=UPI002623460F|nr:MarR family transcriptional regulator [Amycolatopsis sp.]MCU1680607.1 hypothetical protein [Amycolatopsis sp.]
MGRGARDAGFLIRRAQRQNLAELDAALADHGTTMAQWSVLRVITENPGSSARALASHTRQTEQSLGTLVTPMVERGLIERVRRGNKFEHSLTRKGQTLLAECEPVVNAVLDERMSPLSAAEITQLCRLLERIV